MRAFSVDMAGDASLAVVVSRPARPAARSVFDFGSGIF
jgi:hypothetical protein